MSEDEYKYSLRSDLITDDRNRMQFSSVFTVPFLLHGSIDDISLGNGSKETAADKLQICITVSPEMA